MARMPKSPGKQSLFRQGKFKWQGNSDELSAQRMPGKIEKTKPV